MYTIQVSNDLAKVWHNDNGPDIATVVSSAEMKSLRAACDGQYDPEHCPELRARFTAESDFERVQFTIVNESEHGFDWSDAIDAVACYYLPYLMDGAR